MIISPSWDKEEEMARTPKIIFAINPVSNVRVRIDGGGFLVDSKRNPGTWHFVSKDGACDCKGFEFTGDCRHRTVLRRLGMIEDEEMIEAAGKVSNG